MAPNSIPKDSPPAYETTADAASTQFYISIRTAISQERGTGNTNRETPRLRNFLIYCLCVDYCHSIDGSSIDLSGDDMIHYSDISYLLLGLADFQGNTPLNNVERVDVGAYLWQSIHEPCQALGIPAECAVVAVHRYPKYFSLLGGYKGCAYGVLHDYPIETFARKLWLDSQILVPRLFRPEHREAIIGRINELSSMYVASIDGINSSILPANVGHLPTGYAHSQSLSYRLNARGELYQDYQSKSVAVAQDCRLSPLHLARKVWDCIVPFNRRRVDLHETAGPTVARTIGYPSGWADDRGTYLPDMYEARGNGWRSDL